MAERKAPRKAAAAPESAEQGSADHSVRVTNVPFRYAGQGGDMVAECPCGWKRSEHYYRDRLAGVSRTVVEEAGAAHAADPDGGSGA